MRGRNHRLHRELKEGWGGAALSDTGNFQTPKPQYLLVSESVKICEICGLRSEFALEIGLEFHHFLDPFLNQPWAVGGGGLESEEREGRLLKKIVKQLISQTPVSALMG